MFLATSELGNDVASVVEAVKKQRLALDVAFGKLNNERELVTEAVKPKNCSAYVSDKLGIASKFVVKVVKSYDVTSGASDGLQVNRRIIKEMMKLAG